MADEDTTDQESVVTGDQPSSPSSEDLQLARYLALGLSYSEAGRQVGASKATVYRRMTDPDFRALVDAERDERAVSVSEAVTDLTFRALLVLRTALMDQDAPLGVRVRAALGVLAEQAKRTVPVNVQMSGTLGLERIAAMSAEDVEKELLGLAQEIAALTDDPVGSGEPARPAVRDSAPPEGPDVPEAVPAAETATAPQDASDTGDSGDQPSAPDADDDPAPGNVVPMTPRPWQPDQRLTANPWRDADPLGRPIWP